MRPDREERRQLSEEQEAELRAERARAAAQDRDRLGRAARFGWSGTTNRTRPVPCRGCGVEVQVSEYADLVVEATRDFLAKLGEPPITDGELTFCADCGRKHHERMSARRAEEFRAAKAIWHKPLKPTEFEIDWLRRNGFRDWATALLERWSVRMTAKTAPRQRRLGLAEDDV